MTPTPIERISTWWNARLDRPRQCELNQHNHGLPRCENVITLRESEAAGHGGFCSHEHAAIDQENQPI